MRVGLAVGVLFLAAVARADEPPGSPRARQALATCEHADGVPDAEKRTRLAQSLGEAEQAEAEDERDPVAHFAIFCTVGKQTQMAGLSTKVIGNVRRCRREVDRALELAPDYPAALAGKGAFLIELPRLFGGDAKEGERLLRRALELDPDYVRPRLDLARALQSRGAKTEAHTEAERALASAQKRNDDPGTADARALLEKLNKK
jgi:tetratricopeptide (TPR) repeat protein